MYRLKILGKTLSGVFDRLSLVGRLETIILHTNMQAVRFGFRLEVCREKHEDQVKTQ